MKLTDSERFILLMLSEIHKGLRIKGGFDPDFVHSVVASGQEWALRWEYGGIYLDSEDDPEIVREVADILDMWDFIEEGHEKMSEDNQLIVLREVPVTGEKPQFIGFDGNNEAEHLQVASVLINDLGRFPRFKSRGLNSHCPSIDKHRGRLRVFESIRESLTDRRLSPEELIKILNASA